jgi:hypothetical protein
MCRVKERENVILSYLILMWWFGGLEIRRLPCGTERLWDRFSQVAVEFKEIEFLGFLSYWSLGSEIPCLALSDNGDKQEVLCVSCAR